MINKYIKEVTVNKSWDKRVDVNNIQHLVALRLKKYPYFKHLEDFVLIRNSDGVLSFIKGDTYTSGLIERDRIGGVSDFSHLVISKEKDSNNYHSLLTKIQSSENLTDLFNNLSKNDKELLEKSYPFSSVSPLKSLLEMIKLVDKYQQGETCEINNNLDNKSISLSPLIENFFFKDTSLPSHLASDLRRIFSTSEPNLTVDYFRPEFFSDIVSKNNRSMKTILDKIAVYECDNIVEYEGLKDILNHPSQKDTILGILFDSELNKTEKLIKFYDKIAFENVKTNIINNLEMSFVMPKIEDYEEKYREDVNKIMDLVEQNLPEIFMERGNNTLNTINYYKGKSSAQRYSDSLTFRDLVNLQPDLINSIFQDSHLLSKKEVINTCHSFELNKLEQEAYYYTNSLEMLNCIISKNSVKKDDSSYTPAFSLITNITFSDNEQFDLNLFDEFMKIKLKENFIVILPKNIFFNDSYKQNLIREKYKDHPNILLVEKERFTELLQDVIDHLSYHETYTNNECDEYFKFAIKNMSVDVSRSVFLTKITEMYGEHRSQTKIKNSLK